MATPSTIKTIDQLNTKFYQAISKSISTSHLAVHNTWETWYSLLQFIHANKPVSALDIGCGNGRWFEFLLNNDVTFSRAVGFDTDSYLIAEAMNTFIDHTEIEFKSGNIFDHEYFQYLAPFSLVTGFGVWHHIPTYELRLNLLKKLFLVRNSRIIISFWQFHKNPRLLKRCINPGNIAASLELTDHSFEENDYFVGWHGSKEVVRFCHSFSDEEIERIRMEIGLPSTLIYGKGNDATNCYLVW